MVKAQTSGEDAKKKNTLDRKVRRSSLPLWQSNLIGQQKKRRGVYGKGFGRESHDKQGIKTYQADRVLG